MAYSVSAGSPRSGGSCGAGTSPEGGSRFTTPSPHGGIVPANASLLPAPRSATPNKGRNTPGSPRLVSLARLRLGVVTPPVQAPAPAGSKLASAIALGDAKQIRSLARQDRKSLLAEYHLAPTDEPGDGDCDCGNALDLAMYHRRGDVALMLLQVADELCVGGSRALAEQSRHALLVASRGGITELTVEFLRRGASCSRTDLHGRTPLHAAVLRGHRGCVKALLEASAWRSEPKQMDVVRWAHHWEMDQIWKDAGVPWVLVKTPRRPLTPISRSTKPPAERMPPVQSLEALPGSESTPAMLHTSPVALLEVHTKLREELQSAILAGCAVKIEQAVVRGASLFGHYYAPQVEPASCTAPEHGHPGEPALTGHFTPKGASLCLVNPVDWAALHRRWAAVEQLLQLADGKITFNRDEKQSFLQKLCIARDTRRAVCQAAFHGEARILQMLLERRAAVDQKDHQGHTALFLALREGQPGAAELLVRHGAWAPEPHKCAVIKMAQSRRVGAVMEEADHHHDVLAPQAAGSAAARRPSVRRASSGQRILGAGGGAELCSQAWQDMVATLSAAASADEEEYVKGVVMERAPVVATPPAVLGGADGEPLAWSRATSPSWSPLREPAEPFTPRKTAGPPRQRPSNARDCGTPSGSTPEALVPATSLTWREEREEAGHKEAAFAQAVVRRQMAIVKDHAASGVSMRVVFDLGHGERGNCIDWCVVKNRPEQALQLLDIASGVGAAESLAREVRAAYFWSVTQGFTAVLSALLELGADVGQRHPAWSCSDSALSIAVVGSRPAELELLLAHGAWAAEPEERHGELLRWAASRRSVAQIFRAHGLMPPEQGAVTENSSAAYSGRLACAQHHADWDSLGT